MVRRGFVIAFVVVLFAAWLVVRWEVSRPPRSSMHRVVLRNELAARALFGGEVRAMLLADRFGALEALADSLRREDARFASGASRYRAIFHDGFGNANAPGGAAEWAAQLAHARDWAEQQPDSPLPRLALAHILIGRAWAARGGKYADEVSHEQFARFDADLADAGSILEQCPPAAKRDEAWYQARLLVLHSQGSKHDAEYRRLFDEATAIYPGHHEWYLGMADHLLPRWYGAPGDWQRFAARCPTTMPRDYGSEVCARIVAEESWYEPDLFRHPGPLTWPEIRRGLVAWHEHWPASTQPMSEFVRLAAISGHADEARPALAALGDTIDVDSWLSPDYYRSMRRWLETGHGGAPAR